MKRVWHRLRGLLFSPWAALSIRLRVFALWLLRVSWRVRPGAASTESGTRMRVEVWEDPPVDVEAWSQRLAADRADLDRGRSVLLPGGRRVWLWRDGSYAPWPLWRRLLPLRPTKRYRSHVPPTPATDESKVVRLHVPKSKLVAAAERRNRRRTP